MGSGPSGRAHPRRGCPRGAARKVVKRKVVLTPAARDDAHRIDNWWRENRPAAAGLFGEELAASLSLVEVAPEISRPYRHPGIPRLRRVLLRSTRYHVYYVIGDETVRILRLQC